MRCSQRSCRAGAGIRRARSLFYVCPRAAPPVVWWWRRPHGRCQVFQMTTAPCITRTTSCADLSLLSKASSRGAWAVGLAPTIRWCEREDSSAAAQE